jgi:hypothetical protein
LKEKANSSDKNIKDLQGDLSANKDALEKSIKESKQ